MLECFVAMYLIVTCVFKAVQLSGGTEREIILFFGSLNMSYRSYMASESHVSLVTLCYIRDICK